jgi:hypothetical protein
MARNALRYLRFGAVALVVLLAGATPSLAAQLLGAATPAPAAAPRAAIAQLDALSPARLADTPAPNPAAPDLVIESITLTPPNPGAGGTADIEVVVKNAGDAPTGAAFNLYLYVEPAQEPPAQGTTATNFASYALALPANGTFSFSHTGQQFAKDPPKVYAWVDPPWENAVAESNENNNLFPQLASGGDQFEDDDACAGAKMIAPDGTTQSRNLFRHPAADVDWASFEAVSGVTYVVEAKPGGADAFPTLGLFSRCDSAPSFGTGARMTVTAPASGPLFVRVSSSKAEYGPDNAYTLRVTSDSGCANHFEPNNAAAQAGDLPLATDQTHTFCQDADVDWVRVAVEAGAQYRVTSTNVGQKAGATLALYRSSADTAPAATGPTLDFTAATAGHVFVKAEQTAAKGYGAGTDYTLRAERQGGGCAEDTFEQDDALADAKATSANGAVQSRTICPADDPDWVKFSASTGTTYTIETFNLASAADTLLCLFSAGGDQLACDDDGGPGKASRITFEPPTSGDYALRVKDVSPSVAGDLTRYDLRIFQGLCQADVAEDDDARTDARVLVVGGGAVAHNFCPGNDEDWAVFSASGGKSYLIETLNTGPEADTVIELYDANGAFVAQNDDHSPGTTSLVSVQPNNATTYYIKVRQYNPSYAGTGTEYALRVREGTPPATATATAVPTVAPTAKPDPTGIRSLILVNRARLAQLYSEGDAAQILAKLEALAQQAGVRGEIIRLDNNAEVSAAYAAWIADQGNIEKANAVAAAIRVVVVTYLQQRSGVEYLVLVGDDRALPMRRIFDTTPSSPEKTYKNTDVNNPVGAAIKANYYLSDDYFSDREPTSHDGREIFIPDLATGRLIETPSEIIGQIDAYAAKPITTLDNMLVSGYDFVQDVAEDDCDDWKSDFGAPKVDCSLIGEAWTGQAFRALQLRTAAVFNVQSISGHATHYAEGAPVGNAIRAQDIVDAALDLRGGLIYTPGCHAGLNVPPTNADNPLDLPQAFVSKGANYIGNTGYGWGMRSEIGLSEKMIRLYTRALLKGSRGSMGKSLATAKALYYQQDQDLSSYDEKVMQQLVYYGLPMYELDSGAVLSGEDNSFPGVGFTPSLPGSTLGGSSIVTGSVRIDFSNAQNLALEQTGDGDYYVLNGSVHTVPGQPIGPLHFGNVSASQVEARGVLLLGATYSEPKDFDPVVAAPYNEYETATQEPQLADARGMYPLVPISLQQQGASANVVTQLGQYDAADGKLRLLQDVRAEVYYSLDQGDRLSPEATVIDGITRVGSNRVEVKVGAVDASGVERVVLSYIQDVNQSVRQLRSLDLRYDAATQKWVGSFEGNINSRYLVQIVDKAGNITTAANKGQYYTPGEVRAGGACSGSCVYLPVVAQR